MTTVTALPTPVPSTSSPSNFDVRADAFLGALPTFVTELNTVASEVNTNATNTATNASTASTAATTATNAANSATTSANTALNAPGTQATSTSSIALTLGSKTLTLAQTGKSFAVGQWISITDLGSPLNNWIVAVITAFTSGTGAMTVSPLQISGTGTPANWAIVPTSPYNIPIPIGSTLYLAANYGLF